MFSIILLIIVTLANILLGIFVYVKNPKAAMNRNLALTTFALAAWNIVTFLEDAKVSHSTIEVLARLDYAIASLIMIFLFLFCLSMSMSKWRAYKVAVVAAGIAGIIGSLLGLVVSVRYLPNRVVFDPSTLYYPFLLFVVLAIVSGLASLVRRMRKLHGGREREQIKFVLIGFALTSIVVIVTNIVLPEIYNITPIVSRLGIYSTLLIPAFSAYAIIRHKLFDIRAVVARSVTYILSVVTIGLIYGFLAFSMVERFLFPNSVRITAAEQAVNTLLAIILAFTFQPIRRFFQKITDKIFFRDKYDAQELINSVGRILTAEIQLSVLTKEVTAVMAKQMRVDKVDIVVVDDKNIYYQARVLRSDRSELDINELKTLGKRMVVADDMRPGERKDIMDKYGLRVSIALHTSEEFVGYLLLGEKLSGDIYNDQDLSVLRIIANELAVAVQNAKSYTEIQQFNKTLQAKVVAATGKLRKANEDLKELDQAKDEFISMASHQLRTPLTTAKGYVSMVLEGDFGKINSQMKEPLTQALDSSNRMAGLVSDLLNVSRMEAGRFFIDPTDVDLNTEVPAELSQLQTMADAKGVKLTYTKPTKPVPMMKLDLDKTRQVIMNLADNAIHYSAPPNGGGVVQVSLEQVGQDIIYKVVDNGIGVPEAQQKKLFKKFFRAANAQNARPDGTGLGLYLVKRVVEDQGGELVFESKEGKGSTFGFKMPIHNKIRQASKPNGNTQEPVAEDKPKDDAKKA